MTQRSLFTARRLVVYLGCPVCDFVWIAAMIDPDSWWGHGWTPARTAAHCFCRACNRKPPMRVAKVEEKAAA